MATADDYAKWIVDNADKRGTPEFEVVAKAYQEAKSEGQPAQQHSGLELIANTAGAGRIFKTPTGSLTFVSPEYSTSDPAKIKEILRDTKVEPVERALSEQRQDLIAQSPVGAAAAKFMQGIPFAGEYIDEAVGTVNPELQQKVRAVQDAMEKERPYTSTGLRVGGAVAGAVPMAIIGAEILPGLAATTAPTGTIGSSAIKTGLLGGLLGGTEGAVSGYGSGVGQDDRLSKAKEGGLFGTVGGTLAGTTTGAVTNITNNLIEKGTIKSIADYFGVSTDAANILKSTLVRGSDLDSAIGNIRRAGIMGMLADADKQVSKILDVIVAAGGEAGTAARSNVISRSAAASAELPATLDTGFGASPTGMRTAAEEAAARTGPARNAAYDRAYSQPIDYSSAEGRAIEEVLSRIPDKVKRDAIESANEEMVSKGQRNLQIMADIAPDGTVTFREMPNVIQLDELKKALDNIAYGNTDQWGKLTGSGIRYNRLARELRQRLGDAVPDYDTAVKIGGDAIREREAGYLGNMILNPKTTREDVLRFTRDASDTEMKAVRLGARNQIDETLANVKTALSSDDIESVSEARRLLRDMSSRANTEKLQMILGDSFNPMAKKLGEVRAALELQADISMNSKTATRQDLLDRIKELSELGVVNSITRGQLTTTPSKVIQYLTGNTDDALQAKRDSIFSELTSVLTAQGSREAELALKYVNEAAKRGSVSKTKSNYVNSVLRRYGLFAGSESTQKLDEN